MRKDLTVSADVRASRGKNAAHRTRRAGQVPAVIYGAFKEPISIALDPREILKIVHSATGYNTIFNLQIKGGESTPVMVVDHQVDPLKGTLLHADLKRIDLTKRIRVTVPVHAHGEPAGVKVQGGLLEIITRVVEIECLPDDIPEHYVVEVGELMIGQSKRASDVALADSVKLVSDPHSVIAHVVALRVEAEPTPAEGAVAPEAAATTAAEPEVIKKGKKEEEAAPEEKGKKK